MVRFFRPFFMSSTIAAKTASEGSSFPVASQSASNVVLRGRISLTIEFSTDLNSISTIGTKNVIIMNRNSGQTNRRALIFCRRSARARLTTQRGSNAVTRTSPSCCVASVIKIQIEALRGDRWPPHIFRSYLLGEASFKPLREVVLVIGPELVVEEQRILGVVRIGRHMRLHVNAEQSHVSRPSAPKSCAPGRKK